MAHMHTSARIGADLQGMAPPGNRHMLTLSVWPELMPVQTLGSSTSSFNSAV